MRFLPPRLYTIEAAAEMFGVSVDWFYDGIKSGEVRVTDLLRSPDTGTKRRKIRISEAELHRLIAARTVGDYAPCAVACDAACTADCHEVHTPTWKRPGCNACLGSLS